MRLIVSSSPNSHGARQGCRGQGGSGESSKVSLGLILPYHSTPFGRPTLGGTDGCLGDGHPQGTFNLSVIKILNSSCGWLSFDRQAG
jgi:hypothetical protein